MFAGEVPKRESDAFFPRLSRVEVDRMNGALVKLQWVPDCRVDERGSPSSTHPH